LKIFWLGMALKILPFTACGIFTWPAQRHSQKHCMVVCLHCTQLQNHFNMSPQKNGLTDTHSRIKIIINCKSFEKLILKRIVYSPLCPRVVQHGIGIMLSYLTWCVTKQLHTLAYTAITIHTVANLYKVYFVIMENLQNETFMLQRWTEKVTKDMKCFHHYQTNRIFIFLMKSHHQPCSNIKHILLLQLVVMMWEPLWGFQSQLLGSVLALNCSGHCLS